MPFSRSSREIVHVPFTMSPRFMVATFSRLCAVKSSSLGLCMIKDDELYQLFVAREARGTSVAAALLADA